MLLQEQLALLHGLLCVQALSCLARQHLRSLPWLVAMTMMTMMMTVQALQIESSICTLRLTLLLQQPPLGLPLLPRAACLHATESCRRLQLSMKTTTRTMLISEALHADQTTTAAAAAAVAKRRWCGRACCQCLCPNASSLSCPCQRHHRKRHTFGSAPLRCRSFLAQQRMWMRALLLHRLCWSSLLLTLVCCSCCPRLQPTALPLQLLEPAVLLRCRLRLRCCEDQ